MNGSSEREVISRRYPNNETDLDAKSHRGEDAESVTGKMYCHAFLSEGEKEVVNELERILQPKERGWQKYYNSVFPSHTFGTLAIRS